MKSPYLNGLLRMKQSRYDPYRVYSIAFCPLDNRASVYHSIQGVNVRGIKNASKKRMTRWGYEKSSRNFVEATP